MRNYGDKPSNQAKIGLEGDTDYEKVENVRQWIRDNPVEWFRYKEIVTQYNKIGHDISPNYALYTLRELYRVSIANGAAPILARLAKEEQPELKFRMAKSRFDGYIGAVL